MDEAVAYFLDLKMRARGNAYALALIDRCLALIARASAADPAAVAVIDREFNAMRAELEARFGPARALVRH